MMSNKLRQRVSRLFIFFLFLIFGRRHVKFLFKTLREILWIAETNRIGNLGDINERLFQECTCHLALAMKGSLGNGRKPLTEYNGKITVLSCLHRKGRNHPKRILIPML